MVKRLIHVLICATYKSDDPIPSKFLSNSIADVIGRTEEVRTITTYQMPYPIDPISCGLRDVWNRMDDVEHEEFSLAYPDLATAIALMCDGSGDESKEENGKSGTTSDPSSGNSGSRSS